MEFYKFRSLLTRIHITSYRIYNFAFRRTWGIFEVDLRTKPCYLCSIIKTIILSVPRKSLFSFKYSTIIIVVIFIPLFLKRWLSVHNLVMKLLTAMITWRFSISYASAFFGSPCTFWPSHTRNWWLWCLCFEDVSYASSGYRRSYVKAKKKK